MRISIIGCGWLGLPLGVHLKKEGFEIKGSTTHPEKIEQLRNVGIDPFQIRLEPEVQADRDGFFDTDLLLVNIPPRNREGDNQYHIKQLSALANTAAEGAVPHVIYISSTGIYPNLNRVVSESDASGDTKSRGGVNLMEAENVFRSFERFTTTILRLGGLYGPGRHPGRFLAGKQNLPGAKNPVNMIHLDDCLGAITEVIKQQLWNEVFSLCSPTHATRKGFYEAAAKELGIAPPTFSDSTADFKEVSVKKFTDATAYKFKY